MKAIILAGGRGRRFNVDGSHTTKALLDVAGRTVLEWIVEALQGLVSDVVVVTDEEDPGIEGSIGRNYRNLCIHYCRQGTTRGTMAALLAASEHISSPVLVLNGDGIYRRNDLARISRCRNFAFLSVMANADHFIRLTTSISHSILAGPRRVDALHCLNAGVYWLSQDFLSATPELVPSGDEFGLPETLRRYCDERDLEPRAVISNLWLPIGTSREATNADFILRANPGWVFR